MKSRTLFAILGAGALVACVRLTTLTGKLRDLDEKVVRDYKDGRVLRAAARRCHQAAVAAADSATRGPVLLSTGAAQQILDGVHQECHDADVVDGGGNRPEDDLGQGDGVGSRGAGDGAGGRGGDAPRRGDLGRPSAGGTP